MLRHTALLLALSLGLPSESAAQEAAPNAAPDAVSSAAADAAKNAAVSPEADAAPLLLLSGPHNATRFLAAAMDDVARRDGGSFVDLSVAPPPPPTAPAELGRAVAAYQEFDYGRAMQHLTAAFAEIQSLGVRSVSNAELCDLFIYRALVRNAQGDSSAAWDDFVQAALIDPTRHLDAVRFSPSVAASFERARTAVVQGPAHALSVEASGDCTLVIDGDERSLRTPVSLRAGRHYLQLACSGFREYSNSLLLDSDVNVRPELEKRMSLSSQEAIAFANERGFRHVAFVRVPFARPINTALFSLLNVSGQEVGRTSMSLAVSAEDKPLAIATLSRLLDALAPAEILAPLVIAEKRSWYQNPWLWAAAGVVATTAILLPFALQDQPNPGFRIELGGETP